MPNFGLLLNCLLVFCFVSCSTAVFLYPRERTRRPDGAHIRNELVDNKQNMDFDFMERKARSSRSLQKALRRKASSFGQSEDEISQVQYYLDRLKEVADAKNPAVNKITPIRSNSTLDRPQNGTDETDDEIRKQLESWNHRRMSDEVLNPEENGRHYEGDIILTAEQAEAMYSQVIEGGQRRFKRKFIGSKVRRWDSKKPIIYSFDGSHTLREQRVIELALEHWHNITCLDFERHNDEPKGNRIVFTDVDGCASNVGKHPLGEPQFVSLAPECIRLGVIAHEVAHALGFWHEQSRPDRDTYVREQVADVDNGGVPYDYGSIMHYRSKAFARYDDLFTMSTFISDYQRTIGQRDQLSFNDIRLMNVIYCKDTCPRQLPCQRVATQIQGDVIGVGVQMGSLVNSVIKLCLVTALNVEVVWNSEFREGQECSWLLVAPRGQRVQLQFFGEFEMYCKVRHSLCMDYVEIRNSTDFANTGMRYCCFGTPQTSVVSATEDMLVLFRSFYRGGKGFMAQMRAIPAGEVGRNVPQRPASPTSSTSNNNNGVMTRRQRSAIESLAKEPAPESTWRNPSAQEFSRYSKGEKLDLKNVKKSAAQASHL
uniref:Metalloendopeptidase n=1 Tax=Ditylenchus dipsaci TaxID=166011 RepID=A0A915DIT6_9BILA